MKARLAAAAYERKTIVRLRKAARDFVEATSGDDLLEVAQAEDRMLEAAVEYARARDAHDQAELAEKEVAR